MAEASKHSTWKGHIRGCRWRMYVSWGARAQFFYTTTPECWASTQVLVPCPALTSRSIFARMYISFVITKFADG